MPGEGGKGSSVYISMHITDVQACHMASETLVFFSPSFRLVFMNNNS